MPAAAARLTRGWHVIVIPDSWLLWHLGTLESDQLVRRNAQRTGGNEPAPGSCKVTVEAPAIRAEEPGPSDYHDPLIRRELARAAVWMGLAVAIALAVVLAQPLLLIIGGLVFAAILDGGTRLLGRVLPIARAWRLAIICLLALGFLVWTAYFAGLQLVAQAESLQIIIEVQVNRLIAWGHLNGLIPSGSRGNL